MNTDERFRFLFGQYLNGLANESEKIELANFIKHTSDDTIDAFLKSYWNKETDIIPVFTDSEADAILQRILYPRIVPKGRTISLKWKFLRLTAAAVILFTVSVGIYNLFLKRDSVETQLVEQVVLPENILPGGNKATLTLSDGSVISLDDAKEGQIAEQYGIKVLKTESGELAYESGEVKPKKMVYNTIRTPRGGQYRLILPDGTIAFLNAASKIHFPVEFAETERKVEIEGEVFFDVAHKKNSPFIVSINAISVEALGTSFNVMGYADEQSVKTTLITGSVKVTTAFSEATLKPGQQSDIDDEGMIEIEDDVNISGITAWKDGWFRFSSMDLKEIMRQISRWYDLDVIYKGDVPQKTFSGIVSRKSNLDQVLKIMENAGIEFTIQENDIIVVL